MTVRRIWALANVMSLALAAAQPLAAAELSLPVPTIVIYPGDVIRESILVDRDVTLPDAAVGSIINDRAALIGKAARRTLLPGKAIPTMAIVDPKVVLNGSQVRVVFEEGGLTITTYATALQAGAVGDVIKLRNPESGILLSGMIQPDGSVRIGDS